VARLASTKEQTHAGVLVLLVAINPTVITTRHQPAGIKTPECVVGQIRKWENGAKLDCCLDGLGSARIDCGRFSSGKVVVRQ
jgi:hypothetical protein